jgi:hypothetical protein
VARRTFVHAGSRLIEARGNRVNRAGMLPDTPAALQQQAGPLLGRGSVGVAAPAQVLDAARAAVRVTVRDGARRVLLGALRVVVRPWPQVRGGPVSRWTKLELG